MNTAVRARDRRDARLVIWAGGRRYTVPAGCVREIVRAPAMTPVPLGPPLLLGLSRVRGETLAVLAPSRETAAKSSETRHLLVIEGEQRIALAIDRVERLDRAGGGSAPRTERADELKLDALVAEAFPVREDARRGVRHSGSAAAPGPARALVPLLRFGLCDQAFALPLEEVVEVLRVPADIARIPDGDEAVVGAIAWRDATLGVFCPRWLLGLPRGQVGPPHDGRIVVVALGSHRLGLLVDRVEGLTYVAPERIDPVPASLLRADDEARIAAIVRPEGGGRLVSVLASDRLLTEARTHRLLAAAVTSGDARPGARRGADASALLPVRIGMHRLACPLSSIERVARPPSAVTPVPGAPAWLVGIAPIGGEPLVIVDQSLKLAGHSVRGGGRLLLVVRTGKQRLGLLVDETYPIIRLDSAALEPAPLPPSLASGIFGDALQLAEDDAVILVLDPAALLSAAESDFLAYLDLTVGADRA